MAVSFVLAAAGGRCASVPDLTPANFGALARHHGGHFRVGRGTGVRAVDGREPQGSRDRCGCGQWQR